MSTVTSHHFHQQLTANTHTKNRPTIEPFPPPYPHHITPTNKTQNQTQPPTQPNPKPQANTKPTKQTKEAATYPVEGKRSGGM
jgi:hypothetical protein